MSTTDGDASSRLDHALAEVFGDDPTVATPVTSGDDWNVDGPDDDEPYALPEIVPATTHVPAPVEARSAPPDPPTAQPPAARTTPAAPTEPRPATSWGDHMQALPANAQAAPLRAPGRRPRVRRVTRVLRHIDPWSTFKVALLFSVVAYLVTLTAGVLLWRVADSTGTLDNVERWFTQFGWETFELKGGEIFHNAWIIGLFASVALTGGLVLLATLFNLVSDVVGGVRLTVLEEEVVERTVSSTRRYVVRRPPAGAAPTDDDWAVDDDTAVDSSSDPSPSPPSSPSSSTNGQSGSVPTDDWSVDDDEPVDLPDDGPEPPASAS